MDWKGKIVELYDLWWKEDTDKELPFWQKITAEYCKVKFKKKKEICLVELCSGTGRILIPVTVYLAAKFPNNRFVSIGLDYSSDMNKKFMEKVEKLNNEKRKIESQIFIEAREQNLSVENWDKIDNLKVDIFLLPFNHLSLMGEQKIQENIIKNVSKHLVNSGLFILVEYNPKVCRKVDTGEKELRDIILDKDNKRVLFYWRKSFPIDSPPNHRYAQITYGLDCIELGEDSIKISSYPLTMRICYISPKELDAIFNKYKLETLKRLGPSWESINGNPPHFDESKSRAQTVIAAKKPIDKKIKNTIQKLFGNESI
jgi:SAM-dependent methyltransferase